MRDDPRQYFIVRNSSNIAIPPLCWITDVDKYKTVPELYWVADAEMYKALPPGAEPITRKEAFAICSDAYQRQMAALVPAIMIMPAGMTGVELERWKETGHEAKYRYIIPHELK